MSKRPAPSSAEATLVRPDVVLSGPARTTGSGTPRRDANQRAALIPGTDRAQRRDAGALSPDRAYRAHRRAGLDRRRVRNRQGAGRARDPAAQPAERPAVRDGEL